MSAPPICKYCKEFFCGCEKGKKLRNQLVDSMRTQPNPTGRNRYMAQDTGDDPESEAESSDYRAEEETDASDGKPRKKPISRTKFPKSARGTTSKTANLDYGAPGSAGAPLPSASNSTLASEATITRMNPGDRRDRQRQIKDAMNHGYPLPPRWSVPGDLPQHFYPTDNAALEAENPEREAQGLPIPSVLPLSFQLELKAAMEAENAERAAQGLPPLPEDPAEQRG